MLNNTRAVPSHTTSDGRLKLVTMVALDGWDDSALLALTASVATGLDTPVAAAIVDSARERDVQIRSLDQVHHTTGMGGTVIVAGHTVVLRNAAFFNDLGLSIDNFGDWPERLRQRGEQVLFSRHRQRQRIPRSGHRPPRPPAFAAVLMSASTVIVAINAQLLRRARL